MTRRYSRHDVVDRNIAWTHQKPLPQIFEKMPEKEARIYGDRSFTQMMYAKVVTVQLINRLGHDVLFQVSGAFGSLNCSSFRQPNASVPRMWMLSGIKIPSDVSVLDYACLSRTLF